MGAMGKTITIMFAGMFELRGNKNQKHLINQMGEFNGGNHFPI
jgi:hypothetical protein